MKELENDDKVDMDSTLNAKLDVESTENTKPRRSNLIVGLNEIPNLALCILLGLQHYITMFGGTITYPYLLSSKLCILQDDPSRGYLIATTLFCSGFATVIQSTFGVRLPIIQGPTFTFLIPTLSILSLPQWRCNLENLNVTDHTAYTEAWQMRMREVQGALIVSSLVEVLIGCTGIMGLLLQYITPLSIVPSITLIGLSLFQEAAGPAGQNWLFSGLTIILMILFSQYLSHFAIPTPFYNRKRKFHLKAVKIFEIFPVLLTITIVWGLCGVLTLTNVLPEGNAARTDARITLLRESTWVRVPYPFQWGIPSFTVTASIGFFAGILCSAIESVGDYYACARLCESPAPPKHAVNRGICFEGLGCLVSGIWGAGCGLTSYSENIGAIGITKVGSRRVVQVAGLIMMVLSIFSKFTATFATIPVPIVGGVFVIMFGIITAVGLSPLQFIDLNSHRNLFIIGFSIFTGICIPKWIAANPGVIKTGNETLDQVLTIILSTGMLLGGVIAFFLDNTLRGTDEERGIHKWIVVPHVEGVDEEKAAIESYKLPLGLHEFCKKFKILSFIPICSTFTGKLKDNGRNRVNRDLKIPRIEITRI